MPKGKNHLKNQNGDLIVTMFNISHEIIARCDKSVMLPRHSEGVPLFGKTEESDRNRITPQTLRFAQCDKSVILPGPILSPNAILRRNFF